MSVLRPLPPRPSLEYARKEAKALLRRLRAGEPEVLSRAHAQHPQIDRSAPASIRLADAQLVVAREHGFASWPRLVRYLGDVERQQHGYRQLHGGPERFEATARRHLAGHRAGDILAARLFAAYAPRFYGLSVDEALAIAPTEDEARLVVARYQGAPSWEVLLERIAQNSRTQPGDWESDPIRPASEAMAAADLSALQGVIAAHPELIQPSEYDISAGRTLMGVALAQEERQGVPAMEPIMKWLEAQGLDRQLELNRRLCGHGWVDTDGVRSLLDQGADPNWLAPNGIPVLEHALLTYRSGEAVDVLAARTTPRRALWIAAGLGDVDGVRRFLDHNGKPTLAARRNRPDFLAVGAHGFLPPLFDADDEELLVEVLLVAIRNQRIAVIEYLASRGAPLNSLRAGTPLIVAAFDCAAIEVVECLVRCGADLDLRGPYLKQTPREIAREFFENSPESPQLRRLVEICGMNPETILAERNDRSVPPPELLPTVKQALVLAGEDAARQGQSEVRPENLLIGLLRADRQTIHILKGTGRMDVDRLHADLAERIAPGAGQIGAQLPINADVRAAVDSAIAFATERRREKVYASDLLQAVTRLDEDPANELLANYGVDVAMLRADLAKR